MYDEFLNKDNSTERQKQSKSDVSPEANEASKEIVRVEDVSKIYRMGDQFVKALFKVNLVVRSGEFVVLLGPSGSGKSTLLHLIGGLDRPTRGRVIVDGVDFTDKPESTLSKLRHDKIGFVFQAYNLIPVLTALENVELPLIFDPVSQIEVQKRGKTLLELVGLGERLHHRPSQLSGGEQQRVAIARALIVSPSIVIADEPTANIDTATAVSLMELMSKLNREHRVTFIMASHDPKVVGYASRVIEMEDGMIKGSKVLK
jgi:putative ABC transport system ATP-binding protein